MRFFLTALLFLALAGCATAPPMNASSSVEPATLTVVNARVWTGAPHTPWAEALAVRGERLLAVGSRSEVERHTGSGTRVLDAGGQMLLPGFNDAHLREP
jgi:hypothetical protein